MTPAAYQTARAPSQGVDGPSDHGPALPRAAVAGASDTRGSTADAIGSGGPHDRRALTGRQVKEAPACRECGDDMLPWDAIVCSVDCGAACEYCGAWVCRVRVCFEGHDGKREAGSTCRGRPRRRRASDGQPRRGYPGQRSARAPQRRPRARPHARGHARAHACTHTRAQAHTNTRIVAHCCCYCRCRSPLLLQNRA